MRHPLSFLLLLGACQLATAADPNAVTPPPTAEEGKVVSQRESAEWTRMWVQDIERKDKPYALLVGDSITEAYQGQVAGLLAGKARSGYITTSLCVCDPAFDPMLRSALLLGPYAVIHFNNGLHGLGYTEEQYKAGYAKAIKTMRALQPQAKIILTLTTPLAPGSNKAFLNPRMDARNAIVRAIAKEDGLQVDDLHDLVTKNPGVHADPYHYNGKGIKLQAEQVSAQVLDAIKPK